MHISDCCQFSGIHISQGIVATYLRCGGIVKYEFVANLPVYDCLVCRIVKACRLAERLAIEKFESVEVTSACLVFILLLGQHVSPLRLHLQVANQLAEYSSSEIAELLSSQHLSMANAASTWDSAVSKNISKCGVFTLVLRYFSHSK